MSNPTHNHIESWSKSRSGAWAVRGFHYQHLLSTLILIRQWAGLALSGYLLPEGPEDCVVELSDREIWIQIKSRKNGTFSDKEVETVLADAEAKTAAIKRENEVRIVAVLEQPRSGVNEVGIGKLFEDGSHGVLVCKAPGDESVSLLSSQLNGGGRRPAAFTGLCSPPTLTLPPLGGGEVFMGEGTTERTGNDRAGQVFISLPQRDDSIIPPPSGGEVRRGGEGLPLLPAFVLPPP